MDWECGGNEKIKKISLYTTKKVLRNIANDF